MWLTGFDAPSLHTMYLDKPMRGHGLMQAIARVNRVFKDKPGGTVVDYLGLAYELKRALITYTEGGGRGKTTIDQNEAVDLMMEKYEACRDMFHGFDRSRWASGTPQDRLALLPPAQEHILRQKDGRDRYAKIVRELSQAFALAVPHDGALRIRDDVGFFQTVQTYLERRAPGEPRPERDLDLAVRQIVSRGPCLRTAWLTYLRQPGWKSPTCPSSQTSFSPRCGRCPSATWPPSCCRSCSGARLPPDAART